MLGLEKEFFLFKYFSLSEFSIISFRQIYMKFWWRNSCSILVNENMNVAETGEVFQDIWTYDFWSWDVNLLCSGFLIWVSNSKLSIELKSDP